MLHSLYQESQLGGGVASAAAPPAGTVLADVTVTVAGYYEVFVMIQVTVAADVPGKVFLETEGQQKGQVGYNPGLTGGPTPIRLARLYLSAGAHVRLVMSAAGAATTVWFGNLVVNPVSSA